MRGAAARKTEALRGLLSEKGVHSDLASFACPCPLDPSVHLLGLVPEGCGVFKSAMSPLRLTFNARLPGTSGSGSCSGRGAADGAAAGGEGGSVQQPHEVLGRMASLTLASQHSGQATTPQGSRHATRRPSLQRTASSVGAAHGTPSQQQQQGQQHQHGQQQGQQGQQLGASDDAAASLDGSPAASEPPSAQVTLIYKRGDDLRQDQLVVQMISLMDRWADFGAAGVLPV